HVQVPLFNNRTQVSIKQRQKQRADMSPIHIGIRHNDNFMIADFFNVQNIPNANTKSNNKTLDFIIGKYSIHTGLFHVQNLTAQRQDSLSLTVSTHLRATSRRITLYNEKL